MGNIFHAHRFNKRPACRRRRLYSDYPRLSRSYYRCRYRVIYRRPASLADQIVYQDFTANLKTFLINTGLARLPFVITAKAVIHYYGLTLLFIAWLIIRLNCSNRFLPTQEWQCEFIVFYLYLNENYGKEILNKKIPFDRIYIFQEILGGKFDGYFKVIDEIFLAK